MSDASLVDNNNTLRNAICDGVENNIGDGTKSTEENCLAPSNQNNIFPEECSPITKIFQTNDIVDQYLESVVLQNNNLMLVKNHKILLRRDHSAIEDQVKILSGGPIGTDPILSGFIGPGMLTGAVFGQLTSTPPNSDILAALRTLSTNNSVGIVVIVLNSFANRMNFGLACQQAAHEGIKVVCLTVGEDCSGVLVSKQVGRRGSSGIVFLYKIAGAMAQDYKSLYEIYCVLGALKGKSLGSVNVGIQGNAMTVGSDPMKNESGTKVCKITSVVQLVRESLNFIFNPRSFFSINFVKGDRVSIIVNNLGKLNDLYLSLIVKAVYSETSKMEIEVVRLYQGRFFTTDTQPSFSISVLKVTDNILRWLDASVQVSSWPYRNNEPTKVLTPLKERCFNFFHDDDSIDSVNSIECQKDPISAVMKMKNLGPRFKDGEAQLVVEALRSVTTAVLDMEEYLNSLDYDKDFGSTIKEYMEGIKNELDSKTMIIVSPYGLFNHLSELAVTVGGVVGPLFCVLFASAAQAFLSRSLHSTLSWDLWMNAVQMVKDGLCSYTRALPGDGTILDALHPFVETFNQPTIDCLTLAVGAAKKGSEETASRRQRSLPDPGAITLAAALNVALPHLQAYLTEPDTTSPTDYFN